MYSVLIVKATRPVHHVISGISLNPAISCATQHYDSAKNGPLDLDAYLCSKEHPFIVKGQLLSGVAVLVVPDVIAAPNGVPCSAPEGLAQSAAYQCGSI